MSDHREFSRVAVNFPVVLVPPSGEPIHGRLGDISVGGISVVTDAKLEVGTLCNVVVRLMDDVAIEGQGEIIRQLSDGLAVELESLSLDSYEHLCNVLLYNAEDSDQIIDEIQAHPGIRRLGTPLPLSPDT